MDDIDSFWDSLTPEEIGSMLKELERRMLDVKIEMEKLKLELEKTVNESNNNDKCD